MTPRCIPNLINIFNLNKLYFVMRQSISFCLFIVFLLSHSIITAQNGKVDARVVNNYYSCDSLYMYADIEIKANDDSTNFSVADLNVRLSFNRAAFFEGSLTNPSVTIQQELTLSGFVSGTGYTAFYNPHTLTGSLDTVISYNVELAGGDGYPVSDMSWTPVGRIALQVKDATACTSIWIHNNDPINFPPTFVSEKFNNLLYQVAEGSYTNQQVCLPTLCNQAPMAIDDYITTQEGTPIVFNLLANDSDPDNNINPGTLALISTPPTNEVTVVMGPGAGEVTISPTGLWYGNVTPFSYQICDDGGACHSALVYVTVLDDPQTAVKDLIAEKDISIYPTLATDLVTVEFEDGWNRGEEITIRLYSLLGHLISEETINLSGNGHAFETNVGSLPQGAYLLSLSNDAGTYTERIVKQ